MHGEKSFFSKLPDHIATNDLEVNQCLPTAMRLTVFVGSTSEQPSNPKRAKITPISFTTFLVAPVLFIDNLADLHCRCLSLWFFLAGCEDR